MCIVYIIFIVGRGIPLPSNPSVSGAKPKLACDKKWLEPAMLAQTIYILYGLI